MDGEGSGGGDQTKYRGVRGQRQPWGKFTAEIQDLSGHGVRVCLGTFDTAEEAAAAYDRSAYSMLGRNAVLNFPDKAHVYEAEFRRGPSDADGNKRKVASARVKSESSRGARRRRWILGVL
jgi:hypothetical protein